MLAVGTIVLECVTKGESEMKYRDEFPMNEMRDKKSTLDIGHTHVSPNALSSRSPSFSIYSDVVAHKTEGHYCDSRILGNLVCHIEL
jgi:hypothetical protein